MNRFKSSDLFFMLVGAGIFLLLACNNTVDMEPMKIEDGVLVQDGVKNRCCLSAQTVMTFFHSGKREQFFFI